MKMSKSTKILGCIVLALIAVLIGMIIWNQDLRKESNRWEHNYHVAKDSVAVIQTKYDETLYANGSLILERDELEKELGISKKMIKNYEKTLQSKLAYISQLETQLQVKDTIRIKEIVHDTLTNSYSISYNDNWLSFNETFSLLNPEVPELSLYNINMNMPLKVGITDDYTIFVTSPNPYFNVNQIEGAVIDQSKFKSKKQRWAIEAYGGFGISYGLINKTIDIGPQIGGGICLRIF